MMKYTFYIGLNDKDTKTQVISTTVAKMNIAYSIGKLYGCGTLVDGTGFYTHEDGSTVVESSIIVSTSYDGEDGDDKAMEFIKEMKEMMNQESIMLEKYDSIISFE